MTRERADSFVWVAFLVGIGIMILVNLPDDPAPTGAWFLVGAGAIVLGLVGLLVELYGGRRGR